MLNNGRFSPRPDIRPSGEPAVGIVNGLAVHGANVGTLIEVEANSVWADEGKGQWTVTGVVEEEQMGGTEHRITRKSMAKGAVENVLTVLKSHCGLNINQYDIHLNFPGGTPIDGPSAGISMATAIYSSINGRKVDNFLAMTGELSVHGLVKPVGGVMSKVEAARRVGIKRVLIPSDNWLKIFDTFAGMQIIPVKNIMEVLEQSFVD